MGYTQPNKWDVIELATKPKAFITLNNVASSIALESMVVPAYEGTLKHAYLDMYCTMLKDSSGLTNYIDGNQYIQFNDGGSYRNAILIPGFSLQCTGNDYAWGGFWFFGSEDLASYVNSGTTQSIQWASSLVNGADLLIYGICTKLRLYLE